MAVLDLPRNYPIENKERIYQTGDSASEVEGMDEEKADWMPVFQEFLQERLALRRNRKSLPYDGHGAATQTVKYTCQK